VPYILGKYSRFILKKKAVTFRRLVFTFDDGPSGGLTPAVLDLLDKHNTKATFFLLGRNIAGNEQIVKEASKRGHEICSHGFDHLHYWKVWPLKTIKDIKRGWQAIDTALELSCGKYPFRPPYGKLNIICLLYLWFMHVPIIYWTVDSGDTGPVDNRDEHKAAKTISKTSSGIILAHDFKRSNQDQENFTLNSIKLALEEAEKKNLSRMTISELLRTGK